MVREPVPVAVIGGGIAGLAAAQRVAERLGPEGVLLLEGEARLGGKIATEVVDGFVIEGGPDCFLASKPAGVALCRELGIEGRLQATDPRHRRSYVLREGRLFPLPEGLTGLVPSRVGPLLTSSLLSLKGRARAALEWLVPPRRDTTDESVAAFARRRFGSEAYDWLIEPLLGGIFAGDGEALSLEATFPQLKEAESRHGGLLRLMLKRRLSPGGNGNGDGPAGFVTPRGGLGEIVAALERSLAGRCLVSAPAQALAPEAGGGWTVTLAGGERLLAGAVILAVAAWSAAALLAPLDAELARALKEIPFTSTATVSVAFPRGAVKRPLWGSGWVAPRAEGGSVVACTWTSNKFPLRSPEGGVLLRFFIGRSGREDVVAAGEERIRDLVRAELRAVHGIMVEPSLWRVSRWPRGLPQYNLGHRDRLSRIEKRLAALPGLRLAGASYRGVGIPDCVASGWAAADALAAAPALT